MERKYLLLATFHDQLNFNILDDTLTKEQAKKEEKRLIKDIRPLGNILQK